MADGNFIASKPSTSDAKLSFIGPKIAKFRVKHKFGKKKKYWKKEKANLKGKLNKTELKNVTDADVNKNTIPIIEVIPDRDSGQEINISSNEIDLKNLLANDFSASNRKLTLHEQFNETADNKPLNSLDYLPITYNVVDFECINNLLKTSNILCPICKMDNSILFEQQGDKRQGLAIKLNLKCDFCETNLSTGMTSKRVNSVGSRPYDVNSRAVASMFNAGMGFSKLEKFCAGMNMPAPLHRKTYQKKVDQINDASNAAALKCLKQSGMIVRNIYQQLNFCNKEDEVINVSVSFDGTWHTRGHSSLIGIGVVIEIMTGLVLDAEVMCKYCHSCAVGPKEGDTTYEEWSEKHRSQCQVNTDVSSGAMEVEAAKIIWQRSIQLHNMRYTCMLSDGDSKAFTSITNPQVYGDDHPVVKEECVNHVEKRMGTALRNLVVQQKTLKSSIGGRGGLTKVWIDRLTRYYGWAIKDNQGDLNEMYTAIWATFFHSLSTDANPVHTKCPKSWCKFQQAIEKGEPLPKHSQSLPQHIGKLLQPIYERLSKKELLERCLRGATQNPNESFNARIWSRCSKSENASSKTVKIALNQAILEFNQGIEATFSIFEELKLPVGSNTKKFSKKKTVKRLINSNVKRMKSWKVSRIEKKVKRLTAEQEAEEKEGTVYAAGEF